MLVLIVVLVVVLVGVLVVGTDDDDDDGDDDGDDASNKTLDPHRSGNRCGKNWIKNRSKLTHWRKGPPLEDQTNIILSRFMLVLLLHHCTRNKITSQTT